MVGEKLGHYRILEKIGAGGMGEVYLARDERLERDVAVKVLPQGALRDKAIRKRLRKEAQALSRLNHPNIETLLDFDTSGEMEYLVVEYVVGTSLADVLTSGPLPEKEIARLGVQLGSGLAAAHARRVVHCDLKPANLRITSDGRLKILDFGVAQWLKVEPGSIGMDTTTQSTSGDLTGAGTLPYMAPEQVQCLPADARTDIFASGAVLYEMATGRRPFREETASRLIEAVLHEPIVLPRALNSRISPELERIIIKCLEKEPENRYQSAQELEVDLRRLTLPRTTDSIRTSGLAGAGRRRIAGLALVCAAALAVTLVLLNFRGWGDRVFGHREPRIESLAVLPLTNLSGDPQQEYFADGMTEELITDLSQICSPNLRVISRASVMRYQGMRKSTPQIVRELGVDAVIEGSVFRAGNHVRITAQLIQGSTDKQLWANSYDGDMGDVLKLQGEVATAIAYAIKAAVMPQKRQRLASAPAVIPAAYEAYLNGRYEWNKPAERDWQQARQYFEQAVRIDPNYAPAYAGLADYFWASDQLPPNEAMPKAKQYALLALRIDPTLADAYTSLGVVGFYADWNWPGAEREFTRALELDPGDVEGHRMYSAYLAAMGRADEALEESRKAERLDPLSIDARITVGWAFYYGRRYDEALEQCQQVVALEPKSPGAHDCLGLSYLATRRFREAIAESQRAVKLSDNQLSIAVGLARAYALGGDQAGASGILDEWRKRAKRTYVAPSLFAQVYIALGEKQQGLAWLETAYADRDVYMARLKAEPAFDAVRSDAGFQDLMRRLNFPP